MKRLMYLLGIPLLLLAIICLFSSPVVAEGSWNDEAPQWGQDEDMGGGKRGDQDIYNRYTRKDVFLKSDMVNIITAKLTLLIIDWQVEKTVLQASPKEEKKTSVRRSTQTPDKLR